MAAAKTVAEGAAAALALTTLACYLLKGVLLTSIVGLVRPLNRN